MGIDGHGSSRLAYPVATYSRTIHPDLTGVLSKLDQIRGLNYHFPRTIEGYGLLIIY